MGLFDLLPKNPKIEDVLAILQEVDGRVINLEQYVARNEARITALERRYDGVIVVAGERIAQLETEIQEANRALARERRRTDQVRWIARRRRRRAQS